MGSRSRIVGFIELPSSGALMTKKTKIISGLLVISLKGPCT